MDGPNDGNRRYADWSRDSIKPNSPCGSLGRLGLVRGLVATGIQGSFHGGGVVELIRSSIVAVLILMLGEAYRRIPKSLDMQRARRFWGEGLPGDGIALCFGSLVDSRLLDVSSKPPLFRYVKLFRDGRRLQIAGPSEKIIGMCEVRAGSYLINALAKYRRTPLVIEDDQECLKRLNRSIVSIGSSSSNEITEIIEQDQRNRFLRLESNDNSALIRCKMTDSVVTLESSEIRKDHGIILKLGNQRFPGQSLLSVLESVSGVHLERLGIWRRTGNNLISSGTSLVVSSR